MQPSGIYKITCIANQKVYVGSAVKINRRIGEHKSRLLANQHNNGKLQNAWNKYGESQFVFEVIETCGIDVLLEREQFWIDKLDTCKCGFNISPTAGSTIGVLRPIGVYKHTTESRRKISRANKGKKRTPAQAERNRQLFTGRHLSDEHKEKLSSRLKGRKFSEEHKRKIGLANTGRKCSHAREVSKKYVAKRYLITSPSGEMFEVIGLPEFCRTHNLTRSTMADLAAGKIKQGHHKGWKCVFLYATKQGRKLLPQ